MDQGSTLKIISIDDDKIQHILVKKRMLQADSSVQLFPFDEPQNALDWLQENTADLILMDLNFPGLSGWDLLQEIGKISKIPVVVLTGNISPYELEKMKDFPQAIRLFEKPISTEQIADILNYLKS